MLQVQIDEQQVLDIAREEIQLAVRKIESEFVFWDVKTLCEKTCMSRGFILETFFFLPDFPKYKVGTKWLIPAKEATEFLLQWLKKQSTN
ncbi:group-specific protein [Rummeliibacillus sp. G93]|uniref:group-specific protein n=1 Tax=unclassified Rummeliibacillus TaxID=2622809 RepID=UPI00123BF26F|nr:MULTISPECIES: group-specific protein [unclassified Rummeliibacillus]UQW98149.1 group-specific protein [Rummeliibacillus sp. G93]